MVGQPFRLSARHGLLTLGPQTRSFAASLAFRGAERGMPLSKETT